MKDTLPTGAPPPFEPSATLTRGDRVGRYFILERLGAGGMGVVYAAYDPKLGRKVALKLLRRQGAEMLDDELRARLLREAQAMAQLSHPNVLAVHDVGTHEGVTFLAMECAEGGTLAQWLSQRPRGWREVRDRFLLAGRGLAAAHRAGIIHRDFKPENVLLGSDGAVRVTDFGLARGTGGEDDAAASLAPARGLLSTSITLAGAQIGTPAYMSPEQIEGRPCDGRSDQFSFCVSLYEALHGELPYPGADVSEVLESARAGVVTPPRKDRPVPPWLRAVVLRGLRLDPEQRHPTMEALLDALSADPSAQTRRRGLQLAAALAVLAVAAFGWDLQRRYRERCAGGEARFVGVWDDAVRSRAGAAFAATGLPYAEDAWRSAAGTLDAFQRRWVSIQRASCEATHLRGDQSTALLDAKTRCLEQQLDRARAITGILVAADVAVVKSVDKALAPLGEVQHCADTAWVTAAPEPPPVHLREAAESAERELAQLQALSNAGQSELAWQRLQRLNPTVEAIPHPPLQAQRSLTEGAIALSLGKAAVAMNALRAAVSSAEAAGDDATAARAWLLLLTRLHEGDIPPETSLRLADLAKGAIARLPANEALEAVRLQQLTRLLRRERRYDEALTASERALELGRRGTDDPAVHAELLRELGNSLRDVGKYDRAMEVLQATIDATERVTGPRHPAYANALTATGNVALLANNPKAALDLHRRSQEVIAGIFGREHPYFANTLVNVQIGHLELEQFPEALKLNDEEVALRERLGLSAEVSFGRALLNRSAALLELGRTDDAVATVRRAQAIYDARFGVRHAATLTARLNLALALSAHGDHREAVALAGELYAEGQKLLGREHPELTSMLAVRAHVEARSGSATAAVAMARKVIELHAGLPSGNLQHGIDRHELGEALLAAGNREEAAARLREALSCCGLEAAKPVRAARAHLALGRALSPAEESAEHCRRGVELLTAAGLTAERDRALRSCRARAGK